MTRRKMKITDPPYEHIHAVSTLDEADMIFKRAFGARPLATRQDIAPAGWSKVRWVWNKVMFTRGETL